MSKQTIAVQILENTMNQIDGYISDTKLQIELDDGITTKDDKANLTRWNKDKKILQEALYVLTGEST